MPNWAKVATLIIGLGGYCAAVIATLLQGKIPDVATLGIPAALILALAPPITLGRGRAESGASADGQNADEGNEP